VSGHAIQFTCLSRRVHLQGHPARTATLRQDGAGAGNWAQDVGLFAIQKRCSSIPVTQKAYAGHSPFTLETCWRHIWFCGGRQACFLQFTLEDRTNGNSAGRWFLPWFTLGWACLRTWAKACAERLCCAQHKSDAAGFAAKEAARRGAIWNSSITLAYRPPPTCPCLYRRCFPTAFRHSLSTFYYPCA
jgi:hypothetical protein